MNAVVNLFGWILLIGLGATASYAQTAGAEPSQAQKDNLKCMQDAVQLLDDRVSPANVVATGIAVYCLGNGDSLLSWNNIIVGRQLREKLGQDPLYSSFVIVWSEVALPLVLRSRVKSLKQ